MTTPADDTTVDDTAANEAMSVQFREIMREESWAMLDADARRWLGIGGAEFARRYNAGEWPEPDNDAFVMRLAFHLEGLQQQGRIPPY